jgi:hypothetical protein
VAGSCEYGDEPLGSGATELVSIILFVVYFPILFSVTSTI